MKKGGILILFTVIFAVSFMTKGLAMEHQRSEQDRKIEPIVSTEWLASNMGSEDLVIVDIRTASDYAEGHIPGSINAPFEFPVSAWITQKNGLFLELPDKAELFETIGGLGISPDSKVVLVTAPNPKDPAPFYGLANATRAADTLIYAGVPNVAILDGGYPKWTSADNEISTKPAKPTAVEYKADVNDAMFVPIDEVHAGLNKTDIIDARDANVYFGAAVEPWTDKPGHIPGASSLPAPWIWDMNKDGTYTYKDSSTLGAMASGVLGKEKSNSSIIVYCGVGGYASSWWFVLSQVLGYENVKFYDGAAQEWGKHYDMRAFKWE